MTYVLAYFKCVTEIIIVTLVFNFFQRQDRHTVQWGEEQTFRSQCTDLRFGEVHLFTN